MTFVVSFMFQTRFFGLGHRVSLFRVSTRVLQCENTREFGSYLYGRVRVVTLTKLVKFLVEENEKKDKQLVVVVSNNEEAHTRIDQLQITNHEQG